MKAVTKEAAMEQVLIASETVSVSWIRSLGVIENIPMPIHFVVAMHNLKDAVRDLKEWEQSTAQ